MAEFDAGPPPAFAAHFAACPSFEAVRQHFWYEWGPVFWRGRLDGSARLLAVASDPGPTERIACRTLVGDAGQRVQGFLAKVGLTRSYVAFNALPFALFPSHWQSGLRVIADPVQVAWRNQLFDLVRPGLQAVVAFGSNAQRAIDLWPGKGALPVFKVPHPSSRDPKLLLDTWRAAVDGLRAIVPPDPDAGALPANYGTKFTEADYRAIPRRDLPFGFPDWFCDDARGRTGSPRQNNSVERDGLDKLVWQVPAAPTV